MSINADKILQDALEAKEIMDDIIRDGARDVQEEWKWELRHYWDGRNYVDEDGCVISEAEAQAEVDFRNRAV